MNVYDDAGRQLGSVMRITPTRALFRFGTGAPHEDLAEQLQEIGLTVYGHGACAELGDYCLIEATEAEAARLCDCLAGMTAAPSREERYPPRITRSRSRSGLPVRQSSKLPIRFTK